MDASWRPIQGSDPAAGGGFDLNAPAPAGGDWRAQLQPEARRRIVNKIMEFLKKQLPAALPEGLNELHKVSVQFEEKIYNAATNQSDYLRKISLKMISMENAQVIPNQNNTGPAPGLPTLGSNQAESSAIALMSQQQQHLMLQFQSQPNQLQQQLGMQQQPSMQQRLQTSAVMLLQQNNIDQQNQFIQAQRGLQEVSSSSSMDSTARTGHAGVGDWQEEIYQMIKSLKDQYFGELRKLYSKVSMKLQHVDSIIPPQKPPEYERMKNFKKMLERILQMLQINKSDTEPTLRDRIPQYEKQIIIILNSQRKPVQPRGQQQFQQSARQAPSSKISQQNLAFYAASVDSTAQTGHTGTGDLQEEIYQMIMSLKDQYFAELSELYNKISVKLQHIDSIIPPQMPSLEYERMKILKTMLERILQILQLNKTNIQPTLRDKIPQYKKQIISVLNSQRRKTVQQQGQKQLQLQQPAPASS